MASQQQTLRLCKLLLVAARHGVVHACRARGKAGGSRATGKAWRPKGSEARSPKETTQIIPHVSDGSHPRAGAIRQLTEQGAAEHQGGEGKRALDHDVIGALGEIRVGGLVREEVLRRLDVALALCKGRACRTTQR